MTIQSKSLRSSSMKVAEGLVGEQLRRLGGGQAAGHDDQPLGRRPGAAPRRCVRRPSSTSDRPGARCRSNIVCSRGRRRSASMRHDALVDGRQRHRQVRRHEALAFARRGAAHDQHVAGLLGVAAAQHHVGAQPAEGLAGQRRHAATVESASLGRRRRHQRQHRQAEPALDVGRASAPSAAGTRGRRRRRPRRCSPSSPAAARPWLRARADRRRGGLGGIDDADGAAVGGAGQDRFLGLLQQGVEDLAGADRFALERRVGHALPIEGRGLGLLRVQGAGETCSPGPPPSGTRHRCR